MVMVSMVWPARDSRPRTESSGTDPGAESDATVAGRLSAGQTALVDERLRILSVVAKQVAGDADATVKLGKPGELLTWHDGHITVPPEMVLSPRWEDARFAFALQGARRRIAGSAAPLPAKASSLSPEDAEGFRLLESAVELGRAAKFARQAYSTLDAGAPGRLFADLRRQLLPPATSAQAAPSGATEALFTLLDQAFPSSSAATGRNTNGDVSIGRLPSAAVRAARDAINCYPTKRELEVPGAEREYADHVRRLLLEKVWPHFRSLVIKDIERGAAEHLIEQLRQDAGAQKKLQQQLDEPRRRELQKVLEARNEREQQKTQRESGRQNTAASRPGNRGDNTSSTQSRAPGNEPPDRRDTPQQGQRQAHAQRRTETDEQPTGPSPRPVATAESPGASKTDQQRGTEQQPLEARKSPARDEIQPELSPELLDQLRRYLSASKGEERTALVEKGLAGLREFREKLERAARSAPSEQSSGREPPSVPAQPMNSPFTVKANALLAPNRTAYDQMADENADLIGGLEGSLKAELRRRRASGWETGYRAGSGPVHLRSRVSEVARDVPAFASLAFQQLTEEEQLDYAAFLLVDLSPSMRNRVMHAFRGAVVVVEGCSRAEIPIGVAGFSNSLFEAKGIDEPLTPEVKSRLGGFAQNLGSSTDMGWAMDEASKRLADALQKNKVLLVLTDGVPEPSRGHDGPEYLVPEVLKRVYGRPGQIVIVLGLLVPQETLTAYLGPDVPAIGDVTPEGLPGVLATAIEDAVVRKRYSKPPIRSAS